MNFHHFNRNQHQNCRIKRAPFPTNSIDSPFLKQLFLTKFIFSVGACPRCSVLIQLRYLSDTFNRWIGANYFPTTQAIEEKRSTFLQLYFSSFQQTTFFGGVLTFESFDWPSVWILRQKNFFPPKNVWMVFSTYQQTLRF